MKKLTISFLAATLVLTLTACASNSAETSAAQSETRRSSEAARAQFEAELFSDSSAEENTDEDSLESPDSVTADHSTSRTPDDAATLQRCTVDNITFSVDSSLIPQSGGEGIFLSPDQTYAYQLQGITPLGDYTPQEFFDALLETYESKYDIISTDSTVSAYTSPDNVDCYLGNIKMLIDSTFFDIDVLIAPQKNTVVSFAATCYKDDQDIVNIRTVSSTATFQIGDTDYVSGNSFIANDGSELCLYADGTFANYQYADDYDGAYFTGAYEVYYGQPAMDQVISMTEYGLTAEEMEGALLAAQNGYVLSDERQSLLLPDTADSTDTYQVCLDTFYAIILHNDQYIAPDEKPMKVGNTMLFIGYYIPELQLLDMTNANAATYAQYTYKGPATKPH